MDFLAPFTHLLSEGLLNALTGAAFLVHELVLFFARRRRAMPDELRQRIESAFGALKLPNKNSVAEERTS